MEKLPFWTMPKIGVFGSAGGKSAELVDTLAMQVGQNVALLGGITCSGGCGGAPFCAIQGAYEVGGLTLGFSPAMNASEHVEKYSMPLEPHIMVYTGMGYKGRNVIAIRSCDAYIFIAGRWGTMNEFTIAWDEATEGKVIGLLAGSGGYVDKFIIPEIGVTEKPSKAKVVIEEKPRNLVAKMFATLMENQ